MSQTPNILVITPTYNTHLRLLDRCMESVLAQDYPNITYLVVDDGSRYPPPEQVRGQSIHRWSHVGQAATLNRALREQVGYEWWCTVSSDDWVDRDYVSTMYEWAKTDVNAMYVSPSTVGQLALHTMDGHYMHGGALFHRSLHQKLGYLDERLPVFDVDWWARLAANNVRGISLGRRLYHWEPVPGNLTSQMTAADDQHYRKEMQRRYYRFAALKAS